MASLSANVLTFTSTGEVGGTWGSSGAATRMYHGAEDVSMTVVEKVEVPAMVGYVGPGTLSGQVSQSGEGSIEGTLTYEDLPSLLNNLFTHTSGSTGNTSGGTTAPYWYSWSAPVQTTQANASYTLEYGSTGKSYTSVGTILTSLTISGEAGGPWKFSAPWVSKIVKPLSAATTAAWILRTPTLITMAQTHLYWDAISTGTVRSTELQASLISFSLEVNSNRHLKPFAGSKVPGNWGDGKWETKLGLVVEFNSTMKTLIDTVCGASSGAQLQSQISIFNENTTSTGTSGRCSAEIQFAGVQTEPIKLWDDRDGNLTVGLSLTGKYSTALGNYLKFVVENGSSSTT